MNVKKDSDWEMSTNFLQLEDLQLDCLSYASYLLAEILDKLLIHNNP